MGRLGLRNYCIEPTRDDCICETDPRCGGIVTTRDDCPEHGEGVAVPVIIKTHFHPVKGFLLPVGTLIA